MDVTRILEADHRRVEDLFDQIEQAKGANRQPLVHELATALRHMELEETILYPAMGQVTGKEVVQEAHTEDVLRLAPDEPGFGAALDVTRAGIAHHVDEEENEVFTELRKGGESVLEQIATPFMRKRLELGLLVDATALAAASTQDELVAEARATEVGGAASMNKAELAEALVAKMG